MLKKIFSSYCFPFIMLLNMETFLIFINLYLLMLSFMTFVFIFRNSYTFYKCNLLDPFL